jgi:hypothetical protein
LQKTLRNAATKLSLFLCFVCFPITACAFGGAFKGVMVPLTVAELPIPVFVQVEELGVRFSGTAKTSYPMISEGQITSGERLGEECMLTLRMSLGVGIKLEGKCTAKLLQGHYTMYLPSGERRQGTYRMDLVEPEEKKKGLTDAERRSQAVSTTVCLKSNTTCLALCPRGEYSAELVCVNGCKRRLKACKTKAKKSREPLLDYVD